MKDNTHVTPPSALSHPSILDSIPLLRNIASIWTPSDANEKQWCQSGGKSNSIGEMLEPRGFQEEKDNDIVNDPCPDD